MEHVLPNFPKIECPFIRKTYKINRTDWKKYGSALGLRTPEVYLATPEINPTCEWVFTEENVYATEKLHGTGISLDIQNGRLITVQNRTNPVDVLQIIGRKNGSTPNGRVLEGICNAVDRNYIEDNKIQYGELVGPKINGNLHQLPFHVWYSFTKARQALRYTSFTKYPKEFNGWSEWFRTSLRSIFYCRMNKIELSKLFLDEVPFTEGIVIYKDSEHNPEKAKMSKLRRDMYDWYYGDKIEIYDLEPWRIEIANQNKFKLKGYTE